VSTATRFFNNRSLWAYYTIFFSGSAALLYQAVGWNIIGDSVNFLCLLFFLNGFLVKRPLHIFENSLLMTLGYILPLLIRNSLKLNHSEASLLQDFLKLAATSTLTTLALGCLFTGLSFLLKISATKFSRLSRGHISTRRL
jgi:hypothetical protein